MEGESESDQKVCQPVLFCVASDQMPIHRKLPQEARRSLIPGQTIGVIGINVVCLHTRSTGGFIKSIERICGHTEHVNSVHAHVHTCKNRIY
jgi:hypothetical protein